MVMPLGLMGGFILVCDALAKCRACPHGRPGDCGERLRPPDCRSEFPVETGGEEEKVDIVE
jgi:hypothetical protein